jgi:hypothetical protein
MRQVSEALLNVPTGYRVALERFRASVPVGPSGPGMAFSQPAAIYNLNGEMRVMANNPGELATAIDQQAHRRRAQTTGFGAHTAPAWAIPLRNGDEA